MAATQRTDLPELLWDAGRRTELLLRRGILDRDVIRCWRLSDSGGGCRGDGRLQAEALKPWLSLDLFTFCTF